MKTVLTIAGSDCSGGAGVQADLKTMAAHGVFGMSVIVSVVAENTARVIDIQDITPKMIEEQIDAVFEDIVPDVVKIGMLSSPECMKTVAGKLAQYKPAHIVIDPVMFAKNGDPLMDPASVGTLIRDRTAVCRGADSERAGGTVSRGYGDPHARGHGGGGTPHLCQGLQERARQGRQEHRRCGGCTI